MLRKSYLFHADTLTVIVSTSIFCLFVLFLKNSIFLRTTGHLE